MQPHDSWPLDSSEHLVEALREQDATPAEIAELTPALMQLRDWEVPTPTLLDTLRLLAKLTPALLAFSPVRQAIQNRSRTMVEKLVWFLDVASIQVSLLQPSFWLLTVLITLLGMLIILGPFGYASVFVLRIISPLIVYMSTVRLFRGSRLHTLESELACPPSAQQLTLARLLIILSYDMLLGLLLSGVLWSYQGGSFLLLTLHWLTPLLLVTGCALLISLFIPVHLATLLAYAAWLVRIGLAITPISGMQPLPITANMELLLVLVGVLLLLFVILFQEIAVQRFLPR